MAITINGSGTVTGATSMSSAVTFGSTLATASRGITTGSVPAGCIIQVQQITYNDAISASGSSFTDIPNLTTSITPTSSTSKILVCPCFAVGATSLNYQIMFRAYRVVSGVETWIGAGASSGTRTQTSFTVGQQAFDNYNLIHTSWNYLDSPATTSTVTYKFKWADPRDGGTHYIGRTNYDVSDVAVSRSTSTLTLMEIAQ